MLGKLIKHEFRATVRVMGPLYLVLIATAIGANISGRGLIESQHWVLNLLGMLLVIAFTIAICGVCIMALVVSIQRFYKNLLGDEGYIMFTLPASVHQQIWAKLIVSAVWFIATVLMVILAGFIVAYDIRFMSELVKGLRDMFHDFWSVNGVTLSLEMLLLGVVCCFALSLQFYAALAAGHSFSNHKMVLSVGCFFGFQAIMQFLIGCLIWIVGNMDLNFRLTGAAGVHAVMWILIVLGTIYGTIFYVVTAMFLQKRLNLE